MASITATDRERILTGLVEVQERIDEQAEQQAADYALRLDLLLQGQALGLTITEMIRATCSSEDEFDRRKSAYFAALRKGRSA